VRTYGEHAGADPMPSSFVEGLELKSGTPPSTRGGSVTKMQNIWHRMSARMDLMHCACSHCLSSVNTSSMHDGSGASRRWRTGSNSNK